MRNGTAWRGPTRWSSSSWYSRSAWAPVSPPGGAPMVGTETRIATERLSAIYGKSTAVKDVSLAFAPGQVHALIGPSGCGKTTFLRTLNRMHELAGNGWITGSVL